MLICQHLTVKLSLSLRQNAWISCFKESRTGRRRKKDFLQQNEPWKEGSQKADHFFLFTSPQPHHIFMVLSKVERCCNSTILTIAIPVCSCSAHPCRTKDTYKHGCCDSSSLHQISAGSIAPEGCRMGLVMLNKIQLPAETPSL